MGRDLAPTTTITTTPNHAGRLPHPNVLANKDDKRLPTNLIEPNGYHGEKVAPSRSCCVVAAFHSAARAGRLTMEDFDRNLLRMITAELLLLNGMTLAREMYGKSNFALGIGEKIAVDQTVLNMLSGNYQMITPEFL